MEAATAAAGSVSFHLPFCGALLGGFHGDPTSYHCVRSSVTLSCSRVVVGLGLVLSAQLSCGELL